MAQPPPSRLTLRGLLTLPYRLCNPPPAIGKVRSCGVTPVLDIRLDDVLARRHLPPIGLKDFEEYLLYVEHAPENLYFILWLEDYTARYHAWVQREKMSLVNKKDKMASKSQRLNFSVPPTPDPSLAMFYLRAKQTFFTPNGEYELNIPSDVLAPFHCNPHPHALHTHPQHPGRSSLWHSQSVHPDPAVFAEVTSEARCMLHESLKRFIRAASTNVGSQRATCGIAGGCFFTFVTGVLPLVLTTGRWNLGPHGYLIRLVALPGLWFGLTVLVASLQGICLMIYFFGDLRQLRKFELARPTISPPMPMPISSPLSPRFTHVRRQSLLIPSRRAPPVPEKSSTGASSTSSALDSPISFVAPPRPFAQLSNPSLARTSCESCESVVCPSAGCDEIDVSPAYFDDVPAPEGPATASCLYRPEYRLSPPSLTYLEPVHTRPDPRTGRLPTRTPAAGNPAVVDPCQATRTPRSSVKNPSEYGPTAGFISNGYTNSTTSLSETTRSLRSQRSACYFDFDALPPPNTRVGPRRDSTSGGGGDGMSLPGGSVLPSFTSAAVDGSRAHWVAPVSPSTSSSPTLAGPGGFLGRAQYKCKNQFTLPSPAKSEICDRSSFSDTSSIRATRKFSFATWIPSFTAGVPAFAAPLTQVQSPVVKRAQWEVVIRAAFVAAVLAGAMLGLLIGVVP
ncbi:hypothetical protein JVT61DRAFT_11839 [Boletus reticuloceps]|uniref:Uncharacterized protein n=1 Tax=Boletus reticuloceps TaxID=495285 RepID=A0A8I2YVK3_9AGAM|nr:hypothetical protein JVT61DRAFT_11839 [Boletus reticuloceps]